MELWDVQSAGWIQGLYRLCSNYVDHDVQLGDPCDEYCKPVPVASYDGHTRT